MERHLFFLDQPFNSSEGYATELSKLYWGTNWIQFSILKLIALDHSAPTVIPLSTNTAVHLS